MIKRAVLCCLVLSGCGITFGVDAREEAFTAEHEAAGVATVVARDSHVRDEVVLFGGGNTIRASLQTTRWSQDAAEDDSVSVSFTESGDQLEFLIAGVSESVAANRVDIAMPSDLGARVDVGAGDFEARDLLGDLSITSAGLVSLEECTGHVEVAANTTLLNSTQPVDVSASETLNAGLSSGGIVNAKVINLSLDAINGDLVASTLGEGGGRISLFVPEGAAFTLFFQSKERGYAALGEFSYESLDEEAAGEIPRVIAGIEVDIGGGGPRIELRAEAASLYMRPPIKLE